jgi:hypothetical protein
MINSSENCFPNPFLVKFVGIDILDPALGNPLGAAGYHRNAAAPSGSSPWMTWEASMAPPGTAVLPLRETWGCPTATEGRWGSGGWDWHQKLPNLTNS